MIAKEKPSITHEEEQRSQRKKKRKFPFSFRKKEESSHTSERKERKRKLKKQRRPVRRIFPIWLRLIVVILLCAGALLIGLMVGYGVIGDGSPKDVLKLDAWKHIVDIVKKEQ